MRINALFCQVKIRPTFDNTFTPPLIQKRYFGLIKDCLTERWRLLTTFMKHVNPVSGKRDFRPVSFSIY